MIGQGLEQASWGGGIFRGRNAPADSVYDAVNALINDERELYRRGGSVLLSNADAATAILGLADLYLGGLQRTVFWTSARFYALSGAAPTQLATTSPPRPWARPAVMRGVGMLPVDATPRLVRYYGGSLIAAGAYQPATATLTFTKGGRTVTGATTAFVANVDAGSIMQYQSVSTLPPVYRFGIVASVESNTSLTLVEPWDGPSGTFSMTTGSPIAYIQRGDYTDMPYALGATANEVDEFLNKTAALHYIASVARRVLIAVGTRVMFSNRDSLAEWTPGEFHQLPAGEIATGIDGIGNTAVVFTTGGVWTIANLLFDLFDAAGNVQHQIGRVSSDLFLWGDPGIVGWEGALLVPAIDDVYQFTLDGPPVPVSGYVRPLYRSYVEAGYKPGTATVYRGHYVLPILDSSDNLIDVLVVRLDLTDGSGARRPGWTRWANHAAGGAYATRVGSTARTPKLLGINGLRVTELTQAFAPAAAYKADADGTNHVATVVTSDYPTGPGRQNTVSKVRAEYELVDAASDNPTVTVEYSKGPEGSAFTALTAQRGGTENDGTDFSRWRVGKRADRIRFRIKTAGAAASFILRKVGVEISPSGRQ